MFQWYPVQRLADDLDRIAGSSLSLINMFTEPVTMRSIIDTYFSGINVGPELRPAPTYRLRTKHARLFGGSNGYVLNAASVMEALGNYIRQERTRTAPMADAS